MWNRDKNVQVLMMYELLNCENSISIIKVFYCSPFISVQCDHQNRCKVSPNNWRMHSPKPPTAFSYRTMPIMKQMLTLNCSKVANKHKHVVHKNLVGGSSMIGSPPPEQACGTCRIRVPGMIIARGRGFNPTTRSCQACLKEKYLISFRPEGATLTLILE